MTKALKSTTPAIKPMKYRATIEVSLKPGHSDPEGETTARLLKELGYPISTVNVSKVYSIFLEAQTAKNAKDKAEDMCNRLLANPTKDDYTITIEEQK